MIASSARWTTRKRTESPWLKHPKGIRDVEEWYISTVTRRDYVYEVFERQCEIVLPNSRAGSVTGSLSGVAA